MLGGRRHHHHADDREQRQRVVLARRDLLALHDLGREHDREQPDHGDDEQGRRHGQTGGDQGKVGQDTDGDGKAVKPGQKPGQSGGKGLPELGDVYLDRKSAE